MAGLSSTTLNTGSGGDSIIDVLDTNGKKWPVSAIATIDATGTPGTLVAATNPFPIRVCDGSGFVTVPVATQLPAALGQTIMSASLSVVIASNQSAVPISAASLPLPTGAALDATLTGGTATTRVTDGTNTATVKAASTAAVATDKALVVAVSPNGNLVTQVAQGSTTAGQLGPLAQAAVTRYFTADVPLQTAPLTMNAGGAMRASPMHEIDAGAVTGAPWLLAPEVSEDFRQRVEIDNFLDEEVFCYSAQNTGKHTVDTTTMTLTYSGAALNTNGGSITTINTGVAFSTRRSFQVSAAASLDAYMKVVFQAAVPTNTTIDFGFFQRPTATPYAPTDGVYFRATSAGIFGVMNSGGTETLTAAFVVASGGATFVPAVGTEYDCIVTCQPNISVFWIDLRDGNGYIRMGTLSSDSTTKPRPLQSGSAPFSVRHAIGGTVASAGMSFKVISYGVNLGAQALNMPWSEAQNAAGHSGAQGQSGQTQGSTASYANSTAPTAAVMTNTTAALGTGIGGQFACTPTLAVNTDGIVCSFQNPAGTSTLTGRTLIVDSIKIDAVVVVALNASPPVYVYSAAWGHTAVSLATAESANTKAPRRKTLGAHAISAVAIGANGAPIGQVTTTDIAVQPGEFFAITAKNVASAVPASGTILFLVTVCSHWAN